MSNVENRYRLYIFSFLTLFRYGLRNLELHIVNALAVPVSWTGSKRYSLFAGVQDAMTQWWYGHNAVGFFLTAGFLGMIPAAH